MAYPTFGTTEWNELSSAYFRKSLSNTPRDQYFKKHPALAWFRANQREEDTAAKWTWPVMDGSAPVGRTYTGTQGHTPQDVKVATTAEQDCAFYLEPVFISHTDAERTKGSGKTFDLLDQKKSHAMKRVTQKHASLLWSSTQVNATDPMTIRLAIPIDPTANVAFNNLNGSSGNQTWWRNQTDTCTGSWSTDGIKRLDNILNSIADEAGDPDILVTTKAVFAFIQQQQRGHMALQRSTTETAKNMGDLGIPMLFHNGIPIVHDTDATTGCIYALNKDAIKWVANSEGDYKMYGDGFESTIINGVAGSLGYIRLEGNLCVYERRALGQVDGITSA
jgi:hypothetical protein